jgi:hypothetical protein
MASGTFVLIAAAAAAAGSRLRKMVPATPRHTMAALTQPTPGRADMNKMETRHSTNQLRCIDEQGNAHDVTQWLEEARVWMAHNTWSNWGTRQELLMRGSQKVLRLNASELRIESSGESLRLAYPPQSQPPQT